MLAFLRKQWLNVAIVATILLAYLISLSGLSPSPQIGGWIKYCLIVSIFYLSGLTIDTGRFFESIKNWRLHLCIQVVSFVLFPALILLAAIITGTNHAHNLIYLGFVVLACIPTTITSCVVFTRNAGGNEEAAIFNATLGNTLGLFLTPFLIYLLLGKNIDLDPVAAIKKLSLLVMLPFFAGQIGRNVFRFMANPVIAKYGGNWMVLGIMLIAFIAAFDTGIELSAFDLLVILALSLILKLSMTALVWHLGGFGFSRFSRADRICLTITATQKTLALGLPIITILFLNHPHLAVIGFPVIAYHTVQLMVDSFMVSKLKQ